MEQIAVGTSGSIEEVFDLFESINKAFEAIGVKVAVRPYKRGDLTFVGMRLEAPGQYGTKKAKKLFKVKLAEVLADMILGKWEAYLIRKAIEETYPYFNASEQKELFERACKLLDSPESPVASRKRRKAIISKRLRDFLMRGTKGREFLLEGFLTFRLQDYMEQLESLVDQVVDDYLMEREYEEFIRMLKYLVDGQVARISEINVVLRTDGSFDLLDSRGRYLMDDSLDDSLEQLMQETRQGEMTYVDVLISALVTLAPKQIVIHEGSMELPEMAFKALKTIFEGRISFCQGCSTCVVGWNGKH